MCDCTTHSNNKYLIKLTEFVNINNNFIGRKKIIEKKIIIIFIMLFTLSGCSSSTSNKTDDITETKTFLYNYDYETDSNGEVHTDYHEEKPSVDLNESHEEVEPTVNFKRCCHICENE